MTPTQAAILLGPAYPVEAKAIFAAFTTPPTSERKRAISTLVKALKSADVWSTRDLFYILAAADSQAASINLKNPGTFTLTEVNSPTFTADRGYAGNGTTSYLETGWDAATNGVNFIRDNASLGVWIQDNIAVSADALGVSSSVGHRIIPRSAGNVTTVRLNDNSVSTFSPTTDARGLWCVSRPDSATKKAWLNGAQLGSDFAVASTGITSTDSRICGAATTVFSTAQVGAAMWGANLSATQIAALHVALRAYMQSIGAAA